MSGGAADGVSSRPLVVTSDPVLLDDLARIAAAAGVEIDVATDSGSAQGLWAQAPLVVVGPDVSAHDGLSRRAGVLMATGSVDDPSVWRRAVQIGVAAVMALPEAEASLIEALADTGEGRARAVVVGVVGARGGAGASSLAAALSVAGVRAGLGVALIDLDPLGGGLDVVFGAEDEPGTRWSALSGVRGRVPAAAVRDTLPDFSGVRVLAMDRDPVTDPSPDSVDTVIRAAARAFDLVVLDIPRARSDAVHVAIPLSDVTLLVVPSDVRAVSAASVVRKALLSAHSDVRVVVRGPAPSGLDARTICDTLGLPLAASMAADSTLHDALEHGEVPGARRRSALGVCAPELLRSLVPSLKSRSRSRAA
jgi:secretion/DNA translocation related CpaE-like protein